MTKGMASSMQYDDKGEVSKSSTVDADERGKDDSDDTQASPVKNGLPTVGGKDTVLSRMALNDNKAGMEGLDKERINQIIYEASKGSKFFENEKKKEEQLNLRIKEQQAQIETITVEKKNEGIREANKLLAELDASFDLSHTIVHVDMDAFYAAVEMRDDPSLRYKPMAVGGMGMLSTSNYIARRFGVRAAMPGFIGLKLCPDLVLVKPNFEKYTAVSRQVRQVFSCYDPNFCPMSLDEAYLDFTSHLQKRASSSALERTFILRQEENIVQEVASSSVGGKETNDVCACDLNDVIRPALFNAEEIQNCEKSDNQMQILINKMNDENSEESACVKLRSAPCPVCGKRLPEFCLKLYGLGVEEAVLEMRNRIQQKTHLTASAGIAPNTMLAKVCSDRNKPNGQYRILPDREEVKNFVDILPVRKISGIGKVSEKLLGSLGVETCSDLYKHRGILFHLFSPTSFHHFMRISMGLGSSTVERDGERKSMSTEQTFSEIHEEEELIEKCRELSVSLAKDLQDEQLLGKTVTLKIKTVNFEVKTRSHTLQHSCNDENGIFAAAKQLLKTEIEAEAPKPLRLRLMGVRMSKLEPQSKSVTIAHMFQKQTQQVKGNQKGAEKDLFKNSAHQLDSDEENFEEPFEVEVLPPQQGKIQSEERSAQNQLKKTTKSPAKQKGHSASAKGKGPNKSIVSFFNKMNSASEEASTQNSYEVSISQLSQTQTWPTKPELQAGPSELIDLCGEKEDIQDIMATVDETEKSVKVDLNVLAPSDSSNSSDSFPEPSNMIQCPMCLHQKQNWDLDQFNAHVDLCLSRQTIKDILQDQQRSHTNTSPQSGRDTGSSKKRVRQESASTASQKKVKGVQQSQRSVLSFFQKGNARGQVY